MKNFLASLAGWCRSIVTNWGPSSNPSTKHALDLYILMMNVP
jgi:hypothetical protein